eukprot:scaffold141594_cov163-Phaeocystis_antarctica.AAC.1
MNLPSWFSSEWGAETATRTRATQGVSPASPLGLWVATAKKSRLTLHAAIRTELHAHVHVCHTEGAYTRCAQSLSANSRPRDRSATLARAHGAPPPSECRRQ